MKKMWITEQAKCNKCNSEIKAKWFEKYQAFINECTNCAAHPKHLVRKGA